MSARRRRAGRGSAGAPGKDHVSDADFWGAASATDDDADDFEPIRPSDDPTALVRSLGAAPLPGRETVAEHYFAAVYEKAASLAIALASASDLLDDEDDDGSDSAAEPSDSRAR